MSNKVVKMFIDSVSSVQQKFSHLWPLVGNTPMMKLNYDYEGQAGSIYVKCEQYNLTGSIKDRMALYILYKAYMQGSIKENDVIIEATSGNTGIAFSAIGRALGHRVTIIMPDWLSRERQDIISSLGADIILISKEKGGFLGSIRLSRELAAKGDAFLPKQFENQFNAEAHEKTTAPEMWLQLAGMGIRPHAFVAGVGTGGTVMGFRNFLKSMDQNIRVYPLEPAESPTLTTGTKIGSHRIQGISDEFIPAIVDLKSLDPVVQANDGDAIIMAQKLSKECGLAVGISSGANVIGAIKLAQQMGPDAAVCTLLCDSNKKYLSTDLMRVEPARPEYISSGIRFTGFESISRLTKPVKMY